MKVEGVRLVFVTGAGSGIGRAVAERFAKGGATVIVTDIDSESASLTARAIIDHGGSAHAYPLDVTDVDAYESLAARVRAEHGVCDLVVNNAGIASVGEIVATSEADWERVIGINLLGVVTGTRVFAQQMVDAGRHGHIVNIASAAAFAPIENIASYSMTKAAVKMLSDCLRLEFRQYGIGVSAICPGGINTNIAQNAAHAAAVSEEDARTRSAVGGIVQRRMGVLRIFPGPESVARAVESAVRYKRGVVVLRPEGYLVYALNRLSPSLEERLLSVVTSTSALNLALRVADTALVRRILKA